MTETPKPVPAWKRFLPLLLGLVITIAAFVALDRMVATLTLADVKAAFAAVPTSALVLAVLFTALSFAAVSLYDVVAVETIAPGRVSRPLAAAVGAAGYAISNALGFPLLTGGALRYHVYKSGGIELADIGRIVGTSWFALWFALALMVGTALVLDPGDVPLLREVNWAADVAIGLLLIAVVVVFVSWLAGGDRVARIGRFSLPLPSRGGAIVQILAGIVDVGAAAAVLYVLMPAGTVGSFAVFALVFAVAVIVGVASSAPGGLGAFEATIIVTLGLDNRADVVAALLAYRLIYTVLPLLVTVLGLLAVEAVRRRAAMKGQAAEVVRVLEPMVPPGVAVLAFTGGIVLLVSGATPALHSRLGVLSDFLPLPFIEASHLAASFAGTALLVVARGLAKRLWRAWVVSLVLLLAGAAFSIFKGLDWEEATILLVLAALLFGFQHAFYRRSTINPFAVTWGWLAAVSATVIASVWLGFFAYRHIEYANSMWWDFALHANAPRFLRATVIAFALIAAVGLDIVIHRRTDRVQKTSAIPEDVPRIVEASPNTNAALGLLGDKRFLFSPDRRGFVMYARAGSSLIALGEPVGPPDVVHDLAWAFRDLADAQAQRPVFYEVMPESLPLFLDMGLVALKLGEVARVDLRSFTLDGPKKQDLRTAIRRAEREGVGFEILPRTAVPEVMDELREVSDAWLEMKSGTEKGFSLGYFDPAYLAHFDMAVLRKEGAIIAFANLWRGANKEELSIDLMRFLPNASKVVMDVLFARLMLYGKDEGYRWFNLGAAPLSGLVDRRGASRWNRFGSFLYRRGGGFYRFDGLKSFKQKFGPVWTPHYLICPGGFDTARVLVDVTTLISGRPKQSS